MDLCRFYMRNPQKQTKTYRKLRVPTEQTILADYYRPLEKKDRNGPFVRPQAAQAGRARKTNRETVSILMGILMPKSFFWTL